MQHFSQFKARIAVSSEWSSSRTYACYIHIGWYIEKKDGRHLHTYNAKQKLPTRGSLEALASYVTDWKSRYVAVSLYIFITTI